MSEQKQRSFDSKLGWTRRCLLYVGWILAKAGVIAEDEDFAASVEGANEHGKELSDSLKRYDKKLAGLEQCLAAILEGDKQKAVTAALESFELSDASDELRKAQQAFREGGWKQAWAQLESVRDQKLYRDLFEVCRKELAAFHGIGDAAVQCIEHLAEVSSEAFRVNEWKLLAGRAHTMLDEMPRLTRRATALKSELSTAKQRVRSLERLAERAFDHIGDAPRSQISA